MDTIWPCDICSNLKDNDVNWQGIPANCGLCNCYICSKHGGVTKEGDIFCNKCAKEQNVILENAPTRELQEQISTLEEKVKELTEKFDKLVHATFGGYSQVEEYLAAENKSN